MLAYHPRTGKEVRVIQTDASIWRENKTLSYGSNPCIWDTVFDGLLTDGSGPTFRLIIEPMTAEELKVASKKSKMMLISKVAFDSIDDVKQKELKITNMLVLEDIHSMYPHLGEQWNSETADAAVIMAGLLRYRRIAGAWSPRAECMGLVKEDKPPAKLWWITQFFRHGKSSRSAEIRKCLRENANSRLIDKILLLNETKETLPSSLDTTKVQEEVIGHRLTYKDVFERIYDIPDNTIVVFANADIFIDDTSWKDIWTLNLEDKFLALLRYDMNSDNISDARIFGPRADSQDTWVVRSEDVKRRPKSCWESLDFQFGKMGCDNAIALDMMRQKFLVVNPSQTLKTFHVHTSDIRNYSKTDVLERPIFHYIQPSGIHDLMPEFKLEKGPVPVLKGSLRGGYAEAWKKATKFDGFVVSAPEMIRVSNECFQTTEGLVFDAKKMYIGSSEKSKIMWNSSKIHGLMPSIEVGKALVAPWPVGADKCREVYCLKYLSKILRLWDEPGEFFGSEEFEPVLQIFEWNQTSLPIITRDLNSLIWCKEGAVGFCAEETPVLKDDVDALRKYMRGWVSSVSSAKKKIVIMEDGIILTGEFVLELEKQLEELGFDVQIVYPRKSSVERIIDVYSGAWGILCACGFASIGWNWVLPVGANVFEVNSSKTIGLEISTAADLVHWFVKKGDALSEIKGALSFDSETKEDSTLPTIWLPSHATGYFSHAGDSFREMVRLWGAAGYVNVREHPTATHVWWDSVGASGVLLYDRPNNDWRLAAPADEKEWKLALFGNPKVGTANAVPWTFWPRRPSFVEELVSSGIVNRGYDERCAGAVFYGKTENAVQARRRKGEWQSFCEQWVMVKGDEAYPFTQKEYLELLTKARFGLCLPGYGLKCHREIECMAMGCVPIVSNEVDMSSYHIPPIHGKHYLIAANPEDLPLLCSRIDKQTWEEMSAACKEWWAQNASCKGSFELTASIIAALT